MKTVAVVGASLAGLSAVRALRKQGHDGRILVIGGEFHRPYDRPPLSKDFLAGQADETSLALEGDGEDLAAEWLLGSHAVALDGPGRTVHLEDGTTVPADGIVVATGAAARNLPGGQGLEGVHVLRTLDDARALRADLARGGRVVVVGGGFVGAEVASTARGLGLDVTLVQAGPALLVESLGPAMGELVSLLHTDHGVRLLCGVGVHALAGGRRVNGVVLQDGRVLPADTVVVGVGASPCVDWLKGSGVALDNGVLCGADGASSAPGVVAVGDCANWYDPVLGAHRRVEHWSGAREKASTAVTALLSGGTARPGPARPPYFWSDQYGVRIQFAGDRSGSDTVAVEEGAVDDRSFLAVYRRAGHPVAVLAVNRSRAFTRHRRRLAGGAAPKAVALP